MDIGLFTALSLSMDNSRKIAREVHHYTEDINAKCDNQLEQQNRGDNVHHTKEFTKRDIRYLHNLALYECPIPRRIDDIK